MKRSKVTSCAILFWQFDRLEGMERLLAIMRQLRAPNGCPWDQEQTHQSLRLYMLEEAAEAVDAISVGTPLEVAGELGDVLLQVAFHAVIAEETGDYSYETIENAIVEKLIRRHPHVFGDVLAPDSETVKKNWDEIKKLEREGKPEPHPAERVPRALGALARGVEIHKALGVQKGSREHVLEVLQNASDDANGATDVLEAVIAWTRSLKQNPEVMLRQRLEQKIWSALHEPRAT
jgi:XTP/dITP diphosphohydrolase